MHSNEHGTLLLCILPIAIIFVFLLLWYSLQYLPFFDITAIEVKGSAHLPIAVQRTLAPLKGVNRFSIDKKELEKQLVSSSAVECAKVSFRFPSVMVVDLSLLTVQALLSSGGQFYVIKDGKVANLSDEDVILFSSDHATVEIDEGYLAFLKEFGTDEGFASVLDLIASIYDKDTLISRVKYDNNKKGDFGQMILELPSLHAILFVRERVGAKRIEESIGVIKVSSKENPSLLLSGVESRYDLYQRALVKRK